MTHPLPAAIAIAIIAALDREIAPLVRASSDFGPWTSRVVEAQGRKLKLYQHDDVLVVVGGIGAHAARVATDTAFRASSGKLELIISAGLAGALAEELKTGDIVIPAEVVDSTDGLKLSTAGGSGTLVSAGSVADAVVKKMLAARHIARAVDMEAFAVGDVARIHGVPFMAVKAIADELSFPMPPLARFVTAEGSFQTARFALYAALRPWLWRTMARLGRDSSQAAAALAPALRSTITRFRAQGRLQ